MSDQLDEFDGDAADLEAMAEEAADQIREIAEELRDAAQNIEDGFGHPTMQSEELEERADNIENACDELASVVIPPDPEHPGDDADSDDIETFEEDYDNWKSSASEELLYAVQDVELY